MVNKGQSNGRQNTATARFIRCPTSAKSQVLPYDSVGYTHNRLLNMSHNISKCHDRARREPEDFMGPLLPSATCLQETH